MSENLEIWDKVARPPKEALKAIKGGRLSGMTDIKPQWRYKAMTEQFGPCGIGWKYVITDKWSERGSDEQLLCFVNVDLFYKHEGEWSEAIPGSGGSMLITKESKGLHTSDEGYKMALTDALGVAMGKIGVAADIYMGQWDGSKYKDAPKESVVSTKDHIWEGEHKKEGESAAIEVFSIAIKALTTKDMAHKWKKENQSAIDSLGADKGKVMTEYLNKVKELN
jgi:hypothetical protein